MISLRGEDGLRVAVRSVARVGVTPPENEVCMYSTGLNASDFSAGGNARLLLNGCSIQSRGGFSALPSGSNLDIGDCITQEGRAAPASCRKIEDLSDSRFSNPLGIEWADVQAECTRLGRTSTNLNSFRNGELIQGLHCITTDFSTNGGIYRSGPAGVTLFFAPGVSVNIAGNPTFTLQPANEIQIPTSSGAKIVRNVLFYGPLASLRARGTMNIESLGCYGVTMRSIDFAGNTEVALSNDPNSTCDAERDLGIIPGVDVSLLE
jgi:hypothetical protein